MAKKRNARTIKKKNVSLLVPRSEAVEKIERQIFKGYELRDRRI
ncbi:hypothetical protein [Brevibacillus laterosporus]|nr:hypothetical protein [Brevibacillus laterosporus]